MHQEGIHIGVHISWFRGFKIREMSNELSVMSKKIGSWLILLLLLRAVTTHHQLIHPISDENICVPGTTIIPIAAPYNFLSVR